MRVLLKAAMIAVMPGSLLAQGWVIPRPCVMPLDDRVRPAIEPMRNCGDMVVRTRSDVRAELVGNGASRVVRYEVEERFVNNGGRVGEADYLFPLPKGAAFQDLKLSINGELVAGETMNATDARRIYEEIVRRQKDPALVEWMGYGLLRARIFPINPGEEKRVVVRFQMVAEREGDAVRVDYFRGSRVQGQGQTQQREMGPRASEGRSSFILTYPRTPTLGTAYSPTHSLDVSDEGGTRRVEVRGNASDLTLLVPVRAPSEASISVLAHAPGAEDGFALIALAPPASTTREGAMPRDVTLVLDVSGSMAGRKMDQARAAGRQVLRTLRSQDRFRIVDFSSDVHTFRDDFVAATSDNLRAAERYLESLEAQGSTNISGGLREALRTTRDASRDERMPVVLFVTDGEPTVGERSPARIAEEASRDRGRARLFTFGVGADVNVTLLEQLALEGRGTAQFVRPEESVERAVSIVAERLTDPVLTDVRVRVEGDARLSRMLPQQPLDLFAGQDLVVLARYSGHGRARIIVEGRRRREEVRWTSVAEFPERDRDNPFVARLWATQRVGWLAAEKRRNGGSSEIDAEIRQLGERFGIPTEFTSYLVLEPGMVANSQTVRRDGLNARDMRGRATAAAPAAAEARAQAFESARQASVQRKTTSLASADSMSALQLSDASGAALQQVGRQTFAQRGAVWTDVNYRAGAPGIRTVGIKAYSQAYFDLVAALPELRPAFALGDQVIVQGRKVAIIVGTEGRSEVDVAGIVRDW